VRPRRCVKEAAQAISRKTPADFQRLLIGDAALFILLYAYTDNGCRQASQSSAAKDGHWIITDVDVDGAPPNRRA